MKLTILEFIALLLIFVCIGISIYQKEVSGIAGWVVSFVLFIALLIIKDDVEE